MNIQQLFENNSKYLLILKIDKSIGLRDYCVIFSKRCNVSAPTIGITVTDRHEPMKKTKSCNLGVSNAVCVRNPCNLSSS